MAFEWMTDCGEWIAHALMPIVTSYHLATSNVFLNTSTEDAHGLEKWGNTALAPVQFLLAAETGVASTDPSHPYHFQQRFDYHDHLFIKTAGALVAIPLSLTAGCVLKGTAYCFSKVRHKHRSLVQSRSGKSNPLPLKRYELLGIDTSSFRNPVKMSSLRYERRPGSEKKLKKEKKALKHILNLLNAKGILCWADCGTCLGAYRYGGVIPWDLDIDIAVLQSDFAEIKQALQALPRKKYLVEDWSSRLHPGSLLKVYVRKTREYIDIYHFAVNPEKRTIQFILSHADNFLLPNSWKIREQRFTVETPFDLMFPLKVADFDGLEIPVPNQMEAYLQQRYGDDLRPAKIYDEGSQQYIKDPSHPYWQRAHAH